MRLRSGKLPFLAAKMNFFTIRVDAKIKVMSRGPRKQKAQEFYHPTLKEVNGFKDAWRNHVVHVRREYATKDAEGVSSHVGRFMNLLADYGIRETARRKT